MAKLTQVDVKAKADEWAEVQKKIIKAERALNDEIDPYLVKYNKYTEPIRARHEKKTNSLRSRSDELEQEVIGWLNGVGKPFVLDGEKAVAAVELKVGARAIDVQRFFDKVREKNAAFWDCVSVGIAKAEKLLGKTAVDEISSKETKLAATLKLK